MLFSSLSDYSQSVIPADRMAKVLEFLGRDDLADIECGRHDKMCIRDRVSASVTVMSSTSLMVLPW